MAMMKYLKPLTPIAAALACALTMAACSSGPSTPEVPMPPTEPPSAMCPEGQTGTPPNCTTPPPPMCPEGRVGTPPNCEPERAPGLTRLDGILEAADTLLMTGTYARWSLAAAEGGETFSGEPVWTVTCEGARCTAADGTVTALRDLAGASEEAEAELGMRDGFDTSAGTSVFEAAETAEATETVPGATVTASPEAMSWGLWGEHGFAAVVLTRGPLSAELGEDALAGDFASATAYALGAVSGSNPEGKGSATWRGIAEAVSTATFERFRGTATVTITDLSLPRVGVAIDVPGREIGAPGWADMALTDGRFVSGTAGADYLGGAFHGPAHEEVWGVFDTEDHIGAFGAKRRP